MVKQSFKHKSWNRLPKLNVLKNLSSIKNMTQKVEFCGQQAPIIRIGLNSLVFDSITILGVP